MWRDIYVCSVDKATCKGTLSSPEKFAVIDEEGHKTSTDVVKAVIVFTPTLPFSCPVSTVSAVKETADLGKSGLTVSARLVRNANHVRGHHKKRHRDVDTIGGTPS